MANGLVEDEGSGFASLTSSGALTRFERQSTGVSGSLHSSVQRPAHTLALLPASATPMPTPTPPRLTRFHTPLAIPEHPHRPSPPSTGPLTAAHLRSPPKHPTDAGRRQVRTELLPPHQHYQNPGKEVSNVTTLRHMLVQLAELL